jgi:hypothetical protein
VRPSWALKPGLTDRLVVGRKVTMTLTFRPEGSTEAAKDVTWQRTRTQQWKELLFSTGSVPRPTQQWKCFLWGPIPGYNSETAAVKTVFVRRPVGTCQRVNRRTRLRQRNCRESVESVGSKFGDSDWVCRRSWALKSGDSAKRRQCSGTQANEPLPT